MNIWCIQLFQIFQVCCLDISFPDYLRDQSIHQKDSWQYSLAKLMKSWLILCWRRTIFNHCSRRSYWPFWMVLQIVFRMAFSHLPGGLGHFADSNSIPQSLTTTFHLVLTVAIQLTYLPLLVGRLFQRCHLSRIDGVLKCSDYMINFTCSPKFHRVVCIYNFRCLRRLQELICLSVSCEDFVLHG